MHTVIRALKEKAHTHKDKPAIETAKGSMSYARLWRNIDKMGNFLDKCQRSTTAFYLANSPAWVVADLATLARQITTVPIPLFFSSQQKLNVLNNSGATSILSDLPKGELLQALTTENNAQCRLNLIDCIDIPLGNNLNSTLYLYHYQSSHDKAPSISTDIVKITYTSGTTANPKGVLINADGIDKVVQSIISVTALSEQDRYVSLLPLSLLLENVAAVYSVLSVGATLIIPSREELGLSGSFSYDMSAILRCLQTYQASTLILVPALAKGLVYSIQQTHWHLPSLRFVAVGGASVSPQLLELAQQLQFPLYQGYGLSECTSVVALNSKDHHRFDAVGRCLPHVKVHIAEDGEIYVSGSVCSGYLDDIEAQTICIKGINYWKTGDLGYLKDDYLYINGRKKLAFCNAYGRNISPEWVETELLAYPFISSVLFFGENKTANVAIIIAKQIHDKAIANAVAKLNQTLPEYAKIFAYRVIDPNDPIMATITVGAINRQQMIEHFHKQIESMYSQEPDKH